MDNAYVWGSVAIITVVTATLRFLPFALFSKKESVPKFIEKLSYLLPAAVMGMLVIYCIRSTTFDSLSGFLPTLIASLTVILLHAWRRNTLISIIFGTAVYMILIRVII